MKRIGDYYFTPESKMPSELISDVVYLFTCAGCGSNYVGETSRYFDTRVHEHLFKSTQPSSVFKHLESNKNCRKNACKANFRIIDKARSKYYLEIKEAIHTAYFKPDITRQKNLTVRLNY